MDKDKLLYFSEMEVKYSKKLLMTVDKLGNPAIKVLLEAISSDSLKHSKIYKAIIDLLEHKGALISEAESENILKEIEEHIKAEEEMIKNVSSLLDMGVDNKAVEFLLEAILRDEKLHHSVLKTIHEMIVKRLTLTETDLWDMIWKDTAFYGTPGG